MSASDPLTEQERERLALIFLAARLTQTLAAHVVHVTAEPVAEDVVWCESCEEWVTSGAPERADTAEAKIPEPNNLPPRPWCHDCGPGYRLGDEGCRHLATDILPPLHGGYRPRATSERRPPDPPPKPPTGGGAGSWGGEATS